MLMRSNKAETAVHGYVTPAFNVTVVRMRAVMATPWG